MAQLHWTIDDVPWDRLEPAKVDPELIKIIKAAALVEYNAEHYAAYLCRVFGDDPAFQQIARDWAAEEVQHGAALGRWASLVDPSFDFSAAVRRFREGFKLPDVAESRSVRGSCSGELVARCMVEIGTSSFYTAIGDACEEPVLRYLCRHIAADEFRHYKLFLTCLAPYLDREKVGRMRRAWIGVGRVVETQDDELAYAYHSANGGDGAYDRKSAAQAYERRAFRLYRRHHIERAVAMAVKAWGYNPQARWVEFARRVAWWLVGVRVARFERLAA